ncbi:heterocycloanthracin/sonorensin family bacteriocin [Mesobacillus foraminis]|uniref:heterocycloanthracin/sonorensin family bacteriocin n=1 Tax=Mesobacillus foraminis TaxID=279826 RepID=UPI000EF523DA|nr:heterocycloanthracin/sonorensin family bacteriocin [Mesobacillus foraminis]
MNNFQNELQSLNLGDFNVNQAVPWDQNQYYADDSRQFGVIGIGFGRCFSCFRCHNCFSCFSCFSCFRCHNCFNCFRCHNCFHGGGRCGGY